MSWGVLLSPFHLSPGAPSRVWNVQVKTKVPDWYQTSRGGNTILHPHPRRPDNPKVGSVPSRQPVAGVVLHTILTAHLRICTYLQLSPPTSHLPPGIRTRRPWCDPNPHPFIVPTLLVIPRFSGCFYCFSFPLFCSSCLLRTHPPCPDLSLLHLFLDRLTASPRLALHHLRQRPPGQPAHPFSHEPASLECAVRHMGSDIRNLSYYLAPPMTWASI